MEVVRYINNVEVKGEFPTMQIENTAIIQLLKELQMRIDQSVIEDGENEG